MSALQAIFLPKCGSVTVASHVMLSLLSEPNLKREQHASGTLVPPSETRAERGHTSKDSTTTVPQ